MYSISTLMESLATAACAAMVEGNELYDSQECRELLSADDVSSFQPGIGINIVREAFV